MASLLDAGPVVFSLESDCSRDSQVSGRITGALPLLLADKGLPVLSSRFQPQLTTSGWASRRACRNPESLGAHNRLWQWLQRGRRVRSDGAPSAGCQSEPVACFVVQI